MPILAKLVERETADAFDLDNHITIEIGTASISSVRGYTIVAGLCDELAFWPSRRQHDAGLRNIGQPSSWHGDDPGWDAALCVDPYARRGALHDAYRRYFGKPDAPVLVWKAPTRLMNPTFRKP